jgi:hypothetical protein
VSSTAVVPPVSLVAVDVVVDQAVLVEVAERAHDFRGVDTEIDRGGGGDSVGARGVVEPGVAVLVRPYIRIVEAVEIEVVETDDVGDLERPPSARSCRRARGRSRWSWACRTR